MLEIALAVFVPVAAFLTVSRFTGDDFRRVALRWFAPLVVIWFAPYWLTGGTPAPIDYLAARVAPWKVEGFTASNVLLSDVAMQFLPWRERVATMWRALELPALDRTAGSGAALWANPQALVLWPLTLLGLPFSTFAWPLFGAISKVLIALSGMYLFLRNDGRTSLAATFAAIAYAFGAFTFAFLLYPHTNVTTLLPWLLLAIARVPVTGGRAAAAAAVVTALMFLGGHPESMLHASLLAIPFGIRVAMKSASRRVLPLLACGALAGLLLALPVVLPFLHMLPFAERRERLARGDVAVLQAPALTLESAAAFVFPAHYAPRRGVNFSESATQYVGLATFALFVVAARRQRFWLVLFLLLLIPTFFAVPLLSGIPLMGEMLHGRLRFVLAFIIATVAAGGIDRLNEGVAFLRWIVLATAAVIAIAAIAWWSAYTTSSTVVITSIAAGLVTAIALLHPPLRNVLPLLLFIDLAMLGMRFHAPIGRQFFYPPTRAIEAMRAQPKPSRIVGIQNALFPNTQAMFGLEHIGVHDPMAFEPYASLLERAGGYYRGGYFNVFHQLPPRFLADFLGVRAVIVPPGRVVANEGAFPRFFVPRGIVEAGEPVEGFLRTRDAGVVHVRRGAGARVSPASIELLRYTNRESSVRVTARAATFVASSEVALPGWTLARNGEPWPLVGINGPFLGWNVPPGQSEFVLRYTPPGLRMGMIGAIVGLMMLLVMRRLA